jgi:hypothetical protein
MEAGIKTGVEAFVTGLRSDPVELEIRLGHSRPRGFDASVSKEDMDVLLRTLTEAGDVDTREWRESHDYFYGSDRGVVRTTVEFDAIDFTMTTTHLIKSRLGNVDLPRFRVAWASEAPVAKQDVPFATEVQHMRIKQRRSIEIRPPELTVPLWRYDFTMVWSGRNKQEAEVSQRSGPPRYELEVEVVAAGAHELVQLTRDGTAAGGPAAAERLVVEYLTARLSEVADGMLGLLAEDARLLGEPPCKVQRI